MCGNKNPDNIQKISSLWPDYMGFIFYPWSKRYICDLDPRIVRSLPSSVLPVAVFVDSEYQDIVAITKKYKIKIIQLHGKESPVLCHQLRTSWYIVIKQFSVDNNFDFKTIKPYKWLIDYVLFDTKIESHGGSGQVFDWRILKKYRYHIPFFIAGGVGVENITEILSIKHPYLYAVDINSKVESAPWIKNIKEVSQCINAVKKFYS